MPCRNGPWTAPPLSAPRSRRRARWKRWLSLSRQRLRQDPTATPLVFDDATGRPIDLDLRGSDEAVVQRLDDHPVHGASRCAARSRQSRAPRAAEAGRRRRAKSRCCRATGTGSTASPAAPRLPCAGWSTRPATPTPSPSGSASAREATYRFMTAVAGNEPGYEEATRALFAGDRARYDALIAGWPRRRPILRPHAVAGCLRGRAWRATA